MTSDEDDRAYRRKCCRIDHLSIHGEFIRLPGDLAFWNERLAEAIEGLLSAKAQEEQVEARLFLEYRATAQTMGTKATDATVKAQVEVDKRYVSARLTRIEAEARKASVNGTVEAIHAKRDMLISLGAHIRQEMKDMPVIREESRGRRFIEAQKEQEKEVQT